MQDDVFIKELLLEIRNGDNKAFGKFFRSSCQPLVNFTYRFVKDIRIAEELVQDVFVSIWQNRTRINPDLDFKVYLFKAAKNKALNYLKGLKANDNLLLNIDLSSCRVKTPYDGLNEKEIGEAIAQGLENLPDKCRLIFAMNRFDGLTYKEIAETLNISIKTVETQMGRALKFLRKSLIHVLVSITH